MGKLYLFAPVNGEYNGKPYTCYYGAYLGEYGIITFKVKRDLSESLPAINNVEYRDLIFDKYGRLTDVRFAQ